MEAAHGGEAASDGAPSVCSGLLGSAAAAACDPPSKRPSPSEEASREGDKAKPIPRLGAPVCMSAGKRRSGTRSRTSCVSYKHVSYKQLQEAALS